MRIKRIITFVICLLFGCMFINAGLNKFLNYMPVPEEMPEKMMKTATALMEIVWLMPLVGTVEVVAGILFTIPRFRPLAAVIILPVMVGIVLTHYYAAPSGLPMVLVLFAINIGVLIENRKKYAPMIH